jgi:hypothetical protein
MRKYCLTSTFLLIVLSLFLSNGAAADNVSAESAAPASAETVFLPSMEAPAVATVEVTAPSSRESISATTEASTAEPTAAAPEEGTSYKGVPWGADFSTFKTIKSFAGNLGLFSAAFIGSSDDKDIALLLGVPVGSNGSQRVMFEYVPRKFASVYLESDDTYYIFYNGKFAMTFSKINESNFDLYRDTFYKKYQKSGSLAKRYAPSAKQSYLLQAGIFNKGKTEAFLIKSQLSMDKKTFVSTKLVFASSEMLAAIRKEIEDKLAADNLSIGEKEVKELEKDLNKIE